MREFTRILLFLVIGGAIFGFHQWYFNPENIGTPSDVLELREQQSFDEVAARLVTSRGTFTGLEGDRFSWESEDRIQTPEGIAVNITPRTGRLIPDVLILRPGSSGDPFDVDQLSSEDISPGDPVIVSVLPEDLENPSPVIWQIIIAQ